jgi:hypothetical protein|tara:strand:+ start:202 stop:1668 length:1467 start_codon:yes stop_codon:yes gene_type:complete
MANQKPDHIEFAGDYKLDHVFLHNHKGDVVDIKKVMVELNIFESIYKNALTGSIVIADAQNLISKLEIHGTERISFKLSTPGAMGDRSVVNASVETGHPFHVYKITDRKQIAPGTLLYTLHFGSREFMRNMRTKVSQAYEGRLDTAVLKILMDKNYLDSKKELSFEPCGNADKIVIPNLRPFDAINMIARKSLPEKSNGTGYYFYETTKGIYFRSWDNMVSVKGSYDRPTKQVFYYMPMNITDPTIEDKMNHDYKSVESYRFINNFHDVAANTVIGTYGHSVISHNLFDKSYKTTTYNYHNEYGNTKHTEIANEKSTRERYAVSGSKVDEDDKSISDYAESRVSLQSTTQFLHDTAAGGYGLDVQQDGPKLAEGISQRSQVVNGTALHMVVKGQSYLEPGDIIEFKLLAVDEKNPDGQEDPQYSGKYIITKIRHQVNDTKYTMALECAKDSTRRGFSNTDFKVQRNKNNPKYRNTYEAEEPDIVNRHR